MPIDGLEPAIPAHLRVERTRPLKAPPGFTPVHASYSARFAPSVERLCIAYLGVQSLPSSDAEAEQVFAETVANFEAADGPAFADTASYTDGMGRTNRVIAAYWTDTARQVRWEKARGERWWYRSLSPARPIGAFWEVYRPSVADTETTFSHPFPEGYSRTASRMSGKTDTHEYWGSARDRIPRSQVDDLAPRGTPSSASVAIGQETTGRLVVVVPHENLCVLRSGQDWSETVGAERRFYLDRVKPHLDAGMNELNDLGAVQGCYFNRYMQLRDDQGPVEKTYSLSAWHSLHDLERWVRADSHLAIWGAGIKHYKQAGDDAKLRLYHEMAVLKGADQSFAYFNCHRRTGMLNALAFG